MLLLASSVMLMLDFTLMGYYISEKRLELAGFAFGAGMLCALLIVYIIVNENNHTHKH